MQEDNNEDGFALGFDYSLVDVLLVSMMTRLQTNADFFKNHVTNNHRLNRYWMKCKARPGYE